MDLLQKLGHYARTCKVMDRDGKENTSLLKGLDPNKDQSYFLCQVTSKSLSRVLFPVGDLLKTEVRKIAEKNHLCTANKKDSVGICFIGKRPFNNFIEEYIDSKQGNFVSMDNGNVVGNHNGAHLYTLGQGAKIGGSTNA